MAGEYCTAQPRVHPSKRNAQYYATVQTRAEFQRGLSTLKKAGILDAGTDIRSAKPFWTRTAGAGRGQKLTLSEMLSKYDDIVSGKVSPVTVSPEIAKQFKKKGYDVSRTGKLLVPHAATQTVIPDKKTGSFKYTDIHGISRVQIPVEFHDLKQYLGDLQKNEAVMQDMLRKNKRFAFRFYGGHSHVYDSMELMLEELLEYETITGALNSGSTRDMNDVYKNLEILEVSKAAWEKSKHAAAIKARAKRKEKKVKHQRKKKLARLEAGAGWKLEAYREQRREEFRKYRANMSPTEKEAYKAKARARAKKSDKRKGKTK